MKKKNKKYLPLFEKWAKNTLELPGDSGLCYAFAKEGYDYGDGVGLLRIYFDRMDLGKIYRSQVKGRFTRLRQNVVLLLAAINGEL